MTDFSRLGLNWLAAGGEGGKHAPLPVEGMLGYVAIVLVLLFGTMSIAKKDFGNRVFKNWFAQCYEQIYLFIQNLCVGIIGPHGRKYVPMIMTFWLMIFVSNLVSLFFPTAPTGDLAWNLAMALCAVMYVQWEGMRSNGFLGHFGHFAGPKLPIALIPITLMIFVIELISELMKNVSLSLRLYGNIDGGHQAVEAMNKLGGNLVPVGMFLMPIKLLTCVVQALIFCLLTCVYISLVTHHHEDHGDDHHGHDPATAH